MRAGHLGTLRGMVNAAPVFDHAAGRVLTMSSREIADLCEKRHKHARRNIRTLLIGLYGGEHVSRIIPENYRNRPSEFVRENAESILAAIAGDEPKRVHPDRGFSWVSEQRHRLCHR